MGGELPGSNFRDAHHAPFASGINRIALKYLQSGHGRHVDDRSAATVLQHGRYLILHTQPCPSQIYVYHALPRLQSALHGVAGPRRHSRIVHGKSSRPNSLKAVETVSWATLSFETSPMTMTAFRPYFS